jgi:hypothetical protein
MPLAVSRETLGIFGAFRMAEGEKYPSQDKVINKHKATTHSQEKICHEPRLFTMTPIMPPSTSRGAALDTSKQAKNIGK